MLHHATCRTLMIFLGTLFEWRYTYSGGENLYQRKKGPFYTTYSVPITSSIY